MTTITSGRRMIATLAATALVAIGLAAATQSSAQGATLVQKVNVTVSTGGGTVYTNTPVRADFTLANPSTNTGNVDVFSIVVPAGVTGVTIGGASGPTGSVWREALLPCGTRSNCSKILLVYPASFPLSKSFLRPGQSMVASILFTTGNKAGTLPFSFIGIGNGVFTANSTPTITVVSGDAADYLVTGDATLTAGVAGNYSFHTQNASNVDVPFAGGTVTFTLAHTDTPPAGNTTPSMVFGGTTYTFHAPDGAHPLTPWVDVPVPSSGASLGIYNFTLTLYQVGGNIVSAGALGKTSFPQAITTVNPGPAAVITLADVVDAGSPPSPDLSAGKPFTATFTLTDQYGNPTALGGSSLTFSAAGTTGGVLSQGSIVGPDITTNPITPGTIPGNWSKADPAVVFTASLGTSNSSKTKPVVPAEATALIGPSGGSVGTGAGCDPTVSTCGTATFPASTNPTFAATVGVNFCGANDPCTAGQPQILAVTGTFIFDPAAPASATSTCSGDPAVPGACPRKKHLVDVTYFHWLDTSPDHDFDCIATTVAGCTVQSTTPNAPNGCLLAAGCDMHDVDANLDDNETVTQTEARTEHNVWDGTWVDDKVAYPNGQAQQSGDPSNAWVPMPDCINNGSQVPTGAFACLDKFSSQSYVRSSSDANAPLTVIWRFVGDPRTHAPAA